MLGLAMLRNTALLMISTLLLGGCPRTGAGTLLTRGAVHEQKGETKKACRLYWQAVSEGRLATDERFDARRSLVRCAHRLGRLGPLVARARATLKRHPADPLAHYTLALAALKRSGGRMDLALSHLRAAGRAAPQEAEYPHRMGRVLLTASQPANAVSPLRQAISLRRRWAPPRIALARALALLGQAAQARQVLVPLAECSPTAKEVMRGSAVISDMARLADPLPPNARPLFDRAMALLNRDFTAAAAVVLRKACRQFPYVSSFPLLTGLAEIRLSNYGAAIIRLRRAARLNPVDPAPPLHLAEVLANLGRTSDAVVLFGQARRLNPASRRAHVGLGTALLGLRRSAEALPVLRQAAALSGRSAPTLLSLGRALLKAGKLDEAKRVLRKAARWEKTGVRARLALAELLLKQYRSTRDESAAERLFRQAKKLLDEILKTSPESSHARNLRRKLTGSTEAINPRPR
jgi:Flp pilus assembly protein TadD